MFQLTAEEVLENRSQFVTASNRNVSAPPFAFTEQGVAMLSGVMAIAELSTRLEENKNEPRPQIGFK
jgi:hypothetical protein